MEIGQTLQHRYQIEEVLGQGNMGTTYKALDLKTQHPLAVKLLHFSRVQEWKALELFEREAKILQQLSHSHIPAYLDFFSVETSSEAQFFLVQEYIEGKTIQQFVEEGWRGSEEGILKIFMQLIDILDSLHSLFPPVIHRDINPKNIILKQTPSKEACPESCPERIRRGVEGGSGVGSVYLVDFGVVQEKLLTTFLGGSTIVGTFGYIPFEQFSGRTVPASDYYASGATLLYMLTHRHPSDFPSDDLELQFQSFVQASPKIIRLLKGLGILKSMATREAFLRNAEHMIVFYYTPKHASWMNQIELWFSILVRKVIKRGNFLSKEDLKRKIEAFIEYFNKTMAKPFKWTYQGKVLVM